MKRVFAIVLAFVFVVVGGHVAGYAHIIRDSDGSYIVEYVPEPEPEGEEVQENEVAEMPDTSDTVSDSDALPDDSDGVEDGEADDLDDADALDGESELEEDNSEDVGFSLEALELLLRELLAPVEAEPEEPYIPEIHLHMEDAVQPEVPDGEISLMSIGTQPNYPYTGGTFMALNTNYGNGLVAAPEDFKVNTFGFIKGTNRVVNLTNNTINCYWIMGGVTYTARFQRYGELEYYRPSGSNYVWTVITTSALTDSNIQFLDETGERGIQRPYLSLEIKILLVFLFVGILIQGLALIRRR